jgi:hypothetical protein
MRRFRDLQYCVLCRQPVPAGSQSAVYEFIGDVRRDRVVGKELIRRRRWDPTIIRFPCGSTTAPEGVSVELPPKSKVPSATPIRLVLITRICGRPDGSVTLKTVKILPELSAANSFACAVGSPLTYCKMGISLRLPANSQISKNASAARRRVESPRSRRPTLRTARNGCPSGIRSSALTSATGVYQGARYFSFRTRNGRDYPAAIRTLRSFASAKERSGIG